MSAKLHTARKCVFIFVEWIEFVVSIFAVIGIISHLANISRFWTFFKVSGLSEYLKYLFDALIGIELIKLLCKNDLYSMVEVLLFAVTRHMIIEHLKTWELLLGAIAISIIFAIRKFLLITSEKQKTKLKETSEKPSKTNT